MQASMLPFEQRYLSAVDRGPVVTVVGVVRYGIQIDEAAPTPGGHNGVLLYPDHVDVLHESRLDEFVSVCPSLARVLCWSPWYGR